MGLSKAQLLALNHFSKFARNHRKEAHSTIDHILNMSNISSHLFEKAVIHLKTNARIGLHFHPDRPIPNMNSVAEALFDQGEYKSQFETLISNGSVSAYTGGARDLWEKKLFGGAYQQEGTSMSERPKYGALNLMLHPDGPSPRFGSCYFLLSPSVSYRSTYTYLDSHQDPGEKGTYEEFDMILAALLEETFTRDFAIGEKNLTPTNLINHLLYNLKKSIKDTSNSEANRNLNHYIEAQIHGPVSLREDVEVLVADPSFRRTNVGKILEQICQKYSIDLEWHKGFMLKVDSVPSDFRGPSMPSLADRIAKNGTIDAYQIGLAVMNLKRNPDSWSDRGTYEEVLQELKLLWHVLVRYGNPVNQFK